jgi:hypothetical protein
MNSVKSFKNTENNRGIDFTPALHQYLMVKIDYRKAFDSVDRILLWQKLLRTSIDGNMLVIIQNMYKNAKSCDR